MIPESFDYHAPTSLEEAVKLYDEAGGEANLLAGGQSLVPAMKLRLSTPTAVIDLNGIDGLAGVREDDGVLIIGAMTRHHDIATCGLIKEQCPVLSAAAGQIGDVQVRNRGTIGGSLAHADPASDLPAAILAADAEVKVVSSNGERIIAASDFFVELFTTALEPGELITEIRCAPFDGAGGTYLKLEQKASGFAVVGVAAKVASDGGTVSDVAVGVTGLAGFAYRATAVEDMLRGGSNDDESLAAAAAHVADGVEANEDLHASAEYRVHMAKVLTRRALAAAAG